MSRKLEEFGRPEDCAAVRALLVAYSDGEATREEACRVEDHVARCAACARDLAAHRQVGDLLTVVCAPPPDSPDTPPQTPFARIVRARAEAAERRERRTRLYWLAGAAAAVVFAGGLLFWRGSPGTRPGSLSEPGEELLGALDVLEALDKGGVEPAPEIAQALLEAFDGSDPDLVEFLLPEDVAPERL